jgi:hypothetical protein
MTERENKDPNLAIPKTDRCDPRREKPLKDKEDPRCK